MKTPDTDLHQLIHSLSKTEKRYLFLRADREAHYWLLFEAIAAQKKYDETTLKNSGAPFARYLSEQKQYLMDWLLDHLARYHDDSDDATLARALAQVRELTRRGMADPARRRLRRIIRDAEALDCFDRQLEAIQILKSLTTAEQPDILTQLFDAEALCLARLSALHQYAHLNSRINDIQRKFQQSPDPAHRDTLRDLMAHSALLTGPEPETFMCRLYYWQTLATAHFTLGNAAEAYKANRANLDIFEAEPSYIARYPERYLSILQNYLIDSFALRQNEALAAGLERLRNVPSQPAFQKIKGISARVFRQSMQLEINWRLRDGDFDAAQLLLPALKNGLTQHAAFLTRPQKLTFAYLGAYILWGNRDWSHTLDWLQPILQDTREDVVVEIFHFSRLLALICHHELGHDKLLESLVPSTRRQWRRQGLHFEAGQAVAAYILACLKTPDRTGLRKLRRQLTDTLRDLKSRPTEQRLFQYIDLLRWADA